MINKILAFLFCFWLFSYNAIADEHNNKFSVADPNYQITFPRDHGPHENFRIEWWYLTANLKSESIENLGIQWTLFKSNIMPISSKKPNHLNGFWMAHSAITTNELHYFEERFAREKSGQAGVKLDPFKAWIDNWSITGDDQLGNIQLNSSGIEFSLSLKFSTKFDPVLQGNAGFSKKSEVGAASHYYSQPLYTVEGWVILNGERHMVEGVGWLDREWSSNLLNNSQLGWDWFSLHLDDGRKVMLFKVRHDSGNDFLSGSWISQDGTKNLLNAAEIKLEEIAYSQVKGRKIPIKWKISFISDNPLTIYTEALNTNSWMDTSFPYWEGPILLSGDLPGVGYLEMTGY